MSRVRAGIADLREADQIVALNALQRSGEDLLSSLADFRWRICENPAGPGLIPVIRDEAERIAGFVCVVPLKTRIQGRDWLGATATNLVLHPDYRGGFAYAKLLRKFEETFAQAGIAHHFSFVSEREHQRLRLQSSRATATIPLLVKVLKPRQLARELPRSWLQTALRVPAWSLIFRAARRAPDREVRVEPCGHFDGGFDSFWHRIRGQYPAAVIRDGAYLNWRFPPGPPRGYQVLAARKQGRMLGYLVLRVAKIRNTTAGLIMDLLLEKRDDAWQAGQGLLQGAVLYFQEQNASCSACLMTPGAMEYQVLRQAGYQRLPRLAGFRQFRFASMVHQTEEPGLGDISAADWFVTLADWEAY